MQTGIGATLREARGRRKVDLSAVEASTKIRVRYLRAIENEEWDALPGDAYARSFVRTYASFLGLDGDRLAEEYRRGAIAEARSDSAGRVEQPVAPAGAARRRRIGSIVPPRALAAIVSIALVAVLAWLGLSGGGEEGGSPPAPTTPRTSPSTVPSPAHTGAAAPGSGVVLSLAASAEVWVCLLDAGGRALVDGQILEAGAREGPFRSSGFTVSFGNGEVSIVIDGRERSIPASASPIGYAIDSGGRLEPLTEGERPTCT